MQLRICRMDVLILKTSNCPQQIDDDLKCKIGFGSLGVELKPKPELIDFIKMKIETYLKLIGSYL